MLILIQGVINRPFLPFPEPKKVWKSCIKLAFPFKIISFPSKTSIPLPFTKDLPNLSIFLFSYSVLFLVHLSIFLRQQDTLEYFTFPADSKCIQRRGKMSHLLKQAASSGETNSTSLNSAAYRLPSTEGNITVPTSSVDAKSQWSVLWQGHRAGCCHTTPSVHYWCSPDFRTSVGFLHAWLATFMVFHSKSWVPAAMSL